MINKLVELIRLALALGVSCETLIALDDGGRKN